MNSLASHQPAPPPLIIPRRRLSVHQRQGLTSSPTSLDTERVDPIHYYYYPTVASFANGSYPPTLYAFEANSATSEDSLIKASVFDHTAAGNNNPSMSIPTANNAYSFSSGTSAGSAATRGPARRRHSVANGAPWATIGPTATLPPRHALHMPVMKVDPAIWRSEQHQREIYRLMHEGREVEVMRRRGIRNVMDTTTEEDEQNDEDSGGDMLGVEQTAETHGGSSQSLGEQEKTRQEWAKIVAEQTKEYEMILQQQLQQQYANNNENLQRRNTWPRLLEQQQLQLKMPSDVLHPIVGSSSGSFQQQHQLPVPGQQVQGPSQRQDGHGFSTSMFGPLSSSTAWSAAPTFAIDTRKPSFMAYRG
ncbi:hypothetical protein BX616_005311 [Lobosporangium transversale]|uniref:Uncharacterized protein n=1 Tax=Lobosporangium transversale TaxID=64571 RepID=A0A1Y2GCW0_9FUNG|nr:hypothetical protein BCR41DRAFT_389966 [Lobosporangium transversale]KAF9915813.1 hypothetical protein BX616_005311 [Lobosporangium transversale]ORZ04407.1 hypothetical protein BCR41DRAFT_389966 [Lobosporangium transversale]|eukprot:XP_021876515.1 hypothetical protein BCR41DRAFT_389966 [Lobosporangium transversale]